MGSFRRAVIGAVTILFAALAAGGAGATDIYVDTNNPQARDANPGTQAQPLKTVSAGASRANAGDTVWVSSGTYREYVYLPRSGTDASHPITVRSMPGATVELKGSDVVTGWESSSGTIWRKTNWTVNSQQLFADGVPLQQIGTTSPFNTIYWGTTPILPPTGTGTADMPPGSFFYDQAAKILYVRLADGSAPSAHTMEASTRNTILSGADVSFIELHGLKFSHSNVSSVPYMMGMVNVSGQSWVIADCSFTYGDFAGLNITGNGHRILNNVCNHNGDVGISINGSDNAHNWAAYAGRPPQDLVLDGNETSSNNYRGFYVYYQSGGIKAATSCNGVRISRHTALSNGGPGIWIDISCLNMTIERSVLKNNTRGIEFEISDGGLIANNLIAGNANQGIYVSASDSVTVINNTVDGNGYGIVLHGMPRTDHPELKNNTVLNNIISNSATADLVMYTDPAAATGNTSDYNLFYRSGGGVAVSVTTTTSYGVNYRSLGAYTAATGQDSHSLNADPLFAGRAGGDFTLLAASPAIDSGSTNPLAGTVDQAGNARVVAANGATPIIDRGAYEASATAPLAAPTSLRIVGVN